MNNFRNFAAITVCSAAGAAMASNECAIPAPIVSSLQSQLAVVVTTMNGNGGMVSSRSVAREAVKTVMSGPASGVMAAVYTGRRAGVHNLITYDMGGTSTDVAMIRDARAPVSNEIEVEYAMPIHVPMVDVRTVGAGGGSIARVDAGGMLRVGPESAGSRPGPICYGRGGDQPTISDANILLGRLSPERFSHAHEAVRAAFADKIGGPLGLSTEKAAEAVLTLGNIHMAGAIRMVSISVGADPRDFALFAFGGAGPLHATALARELSIPRVLVPARPGITNALGCVVADLRHDFVRTLNRPLDVADICDVHSIFAAQEEEGRRLTVRCAGLGPAMRFDGIRSSDRFGGDPLHQSAARAIRHRLCAAAVLQSSGLGCPSLLPANQRPASVCAFFH